MFDLPGPLANKNPINLGNSIILSQGDKPKQIIELPKSGVQVATCTIDVILDIRVKKNNNSLSCLKLSTDDDNNPINVASVQPLIRAHIKWGTGSNGEFEAEVDFVNGTQLSFPAETITVIGKYLVTHGDNEINPEALCKLPTFELNVGFGMGAVGKNATLTEFVSIKEPGAKKTIQIPQYATVFTVQPTEDSSAIARMFGFAKNLATKYRFTAGGGPDEFGIGQNIRIFNGARFLEITNDNASGTLDTFIIFGLAL